MHHGDDVQQVVLAELLQAVGELLHIHVFLALVLLLCCVLAAYAVCVCGAGFLKESEELWLGVLECLHQMSATQVCNGVQKRLTTWCLAS